MAYKKGESTVKKRIGAGFGNKNGPHDQNPADENINTNNYRKKGRRGRRNKTQLKKLKIWYQNVRGIKSKLISIERIINEIDPTIICMVETHLGDEDEISIPGYKIERNDRNKDGGGCLIAYKEEVKNLVTEITKKETEAIWLKIGNRNAELKICTVYCPSENQPKKNIQRVYEEMEEEIMKEEEKQRTVICGDFNAKIYVNEGEKIKGSGEIMKKFVKENNLEVTNMGDKCQGKWTRTEGEKKSIIDYVLTKDTDDMIKYMIIDEEKQYSACHRESSDGKICYSDHNSIILQIDWMATLRSINKENKIKIMTEKGNEKYQESLEKMKISENIERKEDIDKEYNKWSKVVQEQYEKQQKSVKKSNAWKVNRLLVKQIKLLKSERRIETNEDKLKMLQKRIELIREHCEKEIQVRNAKKVHFMVENIKKTGKTNMAQFWKYNKKKKSFDSVKSVTSRNGKILEDKNLILEEYKNHYIDLLSKKEAETAEEKENEQLVNQLIHSLVVCTDNEHHRKTTVEDVQKAKKELKKRRARDANGWTNEMMINGGNEMDKSLSILFSMMDEQKKPPNMWELIKIKSIFKNNKKKVDSTRGLFITNVVSKLKEKTIKNRNQIYSSPYQCGGKKGRSTADHTLTLLETINRNRYLGCDTYLMFVDMIKCFDKLWLEDGIIELWRAGMKAGDARMIYEMNRKAKAIIETPCGTTDEITLYNVCKQGTVFAVQIGCKTMERINGIGEAAVTCLGPGMHIQALTYVDDISGAGRAETTNKNIRNCKRLEENKKASVNIDKSGIMKVGKNEDNTVTAEVKGGKLDLVKEYKLLGTWINESYDCENNIKKRRNEGEGALKKINQLTHHSKVGNQEIPLKIRLFKTIYITTLLYNMNCWGRLKKKEIQNLEQAQGNALKRLLRIPNSTPYKGVLNETGIWTIEYQLIYNRLMLYQNIINSDEERVAKKMIIELQNHWVEGSWIEKIKEDAERIGIEMEDFKKLMKSKIKKKIKEVINNKMKEEMVETTKMRTVLKTGWGLKEYMEGGFSGDDVREILKVKLHMSMLRDNYKDKNKSLECRLCLKENETTEHIFLKCPILREARQQIEIEDHTILSNKEYDCRKLLRYIKLCNTLLQQEQTTTTSSTK